MKVKLFDSALERFIRSLGKPTIAKVLRTIDLLEIFGPKLGMPHSRKISGELFELRARGVQEIRIFYVFHKNQVVLLHGFIKKGRKIPIREITTASNKLKRLELS